MYLTSHVVLQDVDQGSGEDLNPNQTKRLTSGGEVGAVGEVRNPDRPSASSFVPEAPDLDAVSTKCDISTCLKPSLNQIPIVDLVC